MKTDKVEFYTEVYVITPLIKYLKDNDFKKILCPFDTNDNKIYKALLSEGFEVEQFHINDSVDCIVSNPPYSLKEHVFETLLSTGKPFAMLVGVLDCLLAIRLKLLIWIDVLVMIKILNQVR